jgi:hypothetical protein
MAGTLGAKTRFALSTGHDDKKNPGFRRGFCVEDVDGRDKPGHDVVS